MIRERIKHRHAHRVSVGKVRSAGPKTLRIPFSAQSGDLPLESKLLQSFNGDRSALVNPTLTRPLKLNQNIREVARV